jgi:hypothetical protein
MSRVSGDRPPLREEGTNRHCAKSGQCFNLAARQDAVGRDARQFIGSLLFFVLITDSFMRFA